MDLGTLPTSGATLPGQADLTKSIWDSVAALESSTGLDGFRGAIQSMAGKGTSTPELDRTPSIVEARSSSRSGGLSEAALDDQRLPSQQATAQPTAVDYTDPEAKATADSLTGIAAGAALASDNVKINFQPDSAPVPDGYIKDTGQAYKQDRGYGWVSQDSLIKENPKPLDITPNTRDRNQEGIDQRLDTLIHMQYPKDISNSTAVKTPAAWEHTLPNGKYSVTVSVGDQSFRGRVYDSQHTINVEGVKAINRFQGSPKQEYKQATVEVSVTDGKLTIDAIGGTNTKINYLEIKSVAPGMLSMKDSAYVGINHETGFLPRQDVVDKSIAETQRLGLGSARMGVDSVYGKVVGQPFDFAARDSVVNSYVAAGIDIYAVIDPISHVSRGNNEAEWKANWKYFIEGVMERYKDKINYYVIGNEPEISGVGTPSQMVEMTKIADEVANSVDPNIQIQSPPTVVAYGSDYLKQMLQGGIANYADFIGIHAYGGQILDGRLSQPWEWMEELGIRKPIAITESGVTAEWAPQGMDNGPEWRRRWLPQFYLAAKRYSIDHILLYSLSFSDKNWAFVDRGKDFEIWNPIEPSYSELKNGFRAQVLANGGFEEPNDPEREWIVYYDPDWVKPPQFIDFITGDSAGAQSGSGYVKMGADETKDPIILRRIAAGLEPGKHYRIQGWAFTNGATATLKSLGFDRLDGDKEAVATLSQPGTWTPLAVDFQAWSDHAVVELGTQGTARPGDFVKWDNISIVPLT